MSDSTVVISASQGLTHRIAYEAYLQSSSWRDKRAKVMQRCRHVCEGCGNRQATNVHHLWYPDNEMPGSPQWIALEKLYHLVALCDQCHFEVHHVWEPAKRPKDASGDGFPRFDVYSPRIHRPRP